MNARPSPRLAAILVGFSWFAVAAVIGICAFALAGWWLDIEIFRSLFRWGYVSMNPVTAVALILASVSLAAMIRPPPRRGWRHEFSLACAAIILILGILKLLPYRLTFPVDGLLFPKRSSNNPIAPNTAVGFILTGLALLTFDVRLKTGQRPTIIFALATAVVAMLALTGYLFGVDLLFRVTTYIPMAVNTALAFLLLGTALLAARPDLEPVATILSETAGGVVARRLLPAAAFLPLLIGWLCLLGGRIGFYERPFGLTLYCLIVTMIFMVLTWWNARFLFRLDTDRRRAERSVAEERHLLRSLIDNLPSMVFVKDTEHHFLLNNVAHARTLGAANPQALLGKTDRDYFSAELSEKFRAEERQVVASGAAILDKEQTIRDSSGATIVISVSKVPLYDTDGKVVGIVGIAVDISKRKQAEGERDRFFTLSADMIAIAGFEGYLRRVNPAFETTLGYTPEELTSRPWLDFVHPDDVEATVAEGKKLSLGAVTLFFENRYRCKDGTFRWLAWTAVPVVSEKRIYAVARDITERRRVEEQLRETNLQLEEVLDSELRAQQSLRAAQSTMVQTEKLAGLGQMVAGVAHEINNPLSFVSNNVAVLQRDFRAILRMLDIYGRGEPAIEQFDPRILAEIKTAARDMDLDYTRGNLQELLTRSRDGLKRIQQIVKDLRDFARLDESDLLDVNLNDGIQSTLTIIHGNAKKKHVTLEPNLGDLPRVTCYPAKINQVVMNLLTNAIDASAEGGQVTIRSRAADEKSVRVEVSDNGAGIDPAIRARIFDPFFTTKPQGQGTGLGLSISYGIVRDHNGTIEVRSEVGKGSTFTVTLPISGPKPSQP